MTIISALIAISLMFLTPTAINFDTGHLITIMLAGGLGVFLATIFFYSYILMPLQSLEEKLIPNLLDLIRHEKPLHFGFLILVLFSLVSFLCVAFASRIENVYFKEWLFFGWLVFFGIALDVFRDGWNRMLNLLNPSYLVDQFTHHAMLAIRNDKNEQLLTNIDNLAEIGVRSIEKSKLALSTQTLQSFPPIIKTFLDSAKSIGHIYTDIQEQEQKSGDVESFTIFYLLQRLELINDKALRDRQETVCRQMVMNLGKIIIHCAKYDLSMVPFPTHFLTKFGLKAQQHHFDEVTDLTTSTLLEIAKTILTDIDVTYAELQDPFRAIINGLDVIAKGTFKKHKNISIKVLVQPLLDLKKMFQTPKMANHRDTPVLVQEIDRILEEYSVLEQVMQAIPSIPTMGTPAEEAESNQP